jgi:hypothetical protein
VEQLEDGVYLLKSEGEGRKVRAISELRLARVGGTGRWLPSTR